MFDEPSSYLDVRQRLKAAKVIRSVCGVNLDDDTPPAEQGRARQRFVVVVEHDLSVLDYLSDYVCCLWGKPGAYGVVTMPFSVREGINIFLAGYIPTENLRFRQFELTFKVAESHDTKDIQREYEKTWPAMTKTLDKFKLHIEEGNFDKSEILVMLGQNGTGKTTFIRMLAGLMPPDSGVAVPKLNVSYKPQKIAPKFQGTVRQLLHQKIRGTYTHAQFNADVMKPMMIEPIIDQEVKNLSGGELQRVAMVLCLGKPADIYLIDEPSAYLDSEQRVVAAKVIKRFILHAKKTAFIVEHDFIMATYLADRVIVYTGTPAVETTAHKPQPLVEGMNRFLSDLEITFRRDPTNHRPRINKLNSVKDKEQKTAGTYFYLDTDDDKDDDLSAASRARKPAGKKK
jgi:ATP-binding cassette subfamily E protein 1